MLFSVIVPVYNVKPYLRQCLDSLVGQTVQDLEILVVDDGSTDGSGTICDDYAAQYDSVTVFHQKNGGLSAARNTGLEAARGEWVVFVDSDDWAKPDMLERMAGHIFASDADWYHFGYVFMDEAGKKNGSVSPMDRDTEFLLSDEEERFQLYIRNFSLVTAHVWRSVYRHRILLDHDIRFVSEKKVYAEDALFNFTYLLYVDRIVLSADSVCYYRSRRDSLSHNAGFEQTFLGLSAMPEEMYRAVTAAGRQYFQQNFYKLYFQNVKTVMQFAETEENIRIAHEMMDRLWESEFHRAFIEEIRRHRREFGRRFDRRVWYWQRGSVEALMRRRRRKEKRRERARTHLLFWRARFFRKNLHYARRRTVPERYEYSVDESQHVAYLVNSKAACSSIAVSMLRADDIPDDYSVFKESDGFSRQNPFQRPGWYTFSFVRNPFVRLVSCYESKYHADLERNSYVKQSGVRNLDRYQDGFLREDLGFAHFIRQITMIPWRLDEKHFRSQYHLLIGRDGKPVVDFIGRVEHLAEDYEPIRQRYGFAPLQHYNQVDYGDWRDYYTTKLARKVYRKYRKDVRYFGYEQDYRDLLAYCRKKEEAS